MLHREDPGRRVTGRPDAVPPGVRYSSLCQGWIRKDPALFLVAIRVVCQSLLEHGCFRAQSAQPSPVDRQQFADLALLTRREQADVVDHRP